MKACFESRQLALQSYHPTFASLFRPQPDKASGEFNADSSDSQGFQSEGCENAVDDVPSADPDPQPRVPFAEVDCIYLRYYLFDYDNPTSHSSFPDDLTLRTIYRVAFEVEVLRNTLSVR
jgi:hypothetical protein